VARPEIGSAQSANASDFHRKRFLPNASVRRKLHQTEANSGSVGVPMGPAADEFGDASAVV
jgi:hypothetical protein